jgi:hypothetical protein
MRPAGRAGGGGAAGGAPPPPGARGPRRRPGAAEDHPHLAPQAVTLEIRPVVQERRAPRQVIEDEKRARCHVGGQRLTAVAAGAPGGGRCRLPCRGAGEHGRQPPARDADEPAGERCSIGDGPGPWSARQGGTQRGEKAVARRRQGRHTLARPHQAVLDAHLERIAEADERVASESLAPLGALEEEARRQGPELEVGRDRCVEVRGDVERGLHLSSRTRRRWPGWRHEKTHRRLPGVGCGHP